jgi:hypothetical protein
MINWRLNMKTIITLLTTAVLAIGAAGATSGAWAAEQGSDEAPGNALSWRVARGAQNVGAYASARGGRDFGAYASAREPGQFRNGGFAAPSGRDFQLEGR